MPLEEKIRRFLSKGYSVYVNPYREFYIWKGVEGESFENIIPEHVYYKENISQWSYENCILLETSQQVSTSTFSGYENFIQVKVENINKPAFLKKDSEVYIYLPEKEFNQIIHKFIYSTTNGFYKLVL